MSSVPSTNRGSELCFLGLQWTHRWSWARLSHTHFPCRSPSRRAPCRCTLRFSHTHSSTGRPTAPCPARSCRTPTPAASMPSSPRWPFGPEATSLLAQGRTTRQANCRTASAGAVQRKATASATLRRSWSSRRLGQLSLLVQSRHLVGRSVLKSQMALSCRLFFRLWANFFVMISVTLWPPSIPSSSRTRRPRKGRRGNPRGSLAALPARRAAQAGAPPLCRIAPRRTGTMGPWLRIRRWPELLLLLPIRKRLYKSNQLFIYKSDNVQEFNRGGFRSLIIPVEMGNLMNNYRFIRSSSKDESWEK